MVTSNYTGLEIAVIGIGLRFPGADSPAQFWQNLREGKESIAFSTDAELEALGYPADLVKDPHFVKTGGGKVKDADCFDASFFGYTPVEAGIMDPQMRLFHEVVWAALEDGGYYADRYPGKIGLFAGRGPSTVWDSFNFISGRTRNMNAWEVEQYTNSDFMTTKIAYKLNLKGPCYAIDTACSTSLVTVHVACRSILTGECDMALAGGVTVKPLPNYGYLYVEGMAKSRDGHCRAFDHEASGFVSGNGAGAVLLKPLNKAIADNDHIYAIIKGSAINNDGNRKVGYTAPSVEGQAEVIRMALQVARVDPETITYVEAHGAGTPIGDPIEIASLKRAFRSGKKQFCAIGSVKTNVGHLDRAAGIAGFIKTVLAVKHQMLPPSLHFSQANPRLEIQDSPFYVNTRLQRWQPDQVPVRAGVTSLGIGGTNAHIVLEAAPRREPLPERGVAELIVLSAKDPQALDRKTRDLTDYLQTESETRLGPLAYTLKVGRGDFRYRRFVVCKHPADLLEKLAHGQYTTGEAKSQLPVYLMFSGQGSQHVTMGAGVYSNNAFFREQLDACFGLYERIANVKLKDILYPAPVPDGAAGMPERINEVIYSGPVKFCFEYSLARLLLHLGVQPTALIGHSFGEYAAACLSGVFTLEDALRIVHVRGLLMQQTGEGAMMSVTLPEADVQPLLGADLSVAAVNDAEHCIVSGPSKSVARLEDRLKEAGIDCLSLNFPKAGHSPLMLSIARAFEMELGKVTFSAPQVPLISGVTGAYATAREITTPAYWVRHLLSTIRFSQGITTLSAGGEALYVQIGCDKGLPLFTRKITGNASAAFNLIRSAGDPTDDWSYFLNGLGKIWAGGIQVNWDALNPEKKGQRVPLPAYPFARDPYPLIGGETEVGKMLRNAGLAGSEGNKTGDWLYAPAWVKRGKLPAEMPEAKSGVWLVFSDGAGVAEGLEAAGQGSTVIRVTAAGAYHFDGSHFQINPDSPADYAQVLECLNDQGIMPDKVVHLWGIDAAPAAAGTLEETLRAGFFSLLFLAKALIQSNCDKEVDLEVVTTNMQSIVGNELTAPVKATVLGALKVISLELPHVRVRSIDLDGHETGRDSTLAVRALLDEFRARPCRTVVGYRNHVRWEQTYLPVEARAHPASLAGVVKPGGTYLITGGLGGIGLVLADCLARAANVTLILVSRSGLTGPETPGSAAAGKRDAIRQIETKGSRVLVVRADVAEATFVAELQAVIEQHTGQLHGIIHAAGLMDTAGPIGLRDAGFTRQLLSPKIEGTIHLQQLAALYEPAFMVLCSSNNAVIPVPGQFSHSAANAFLDAWAQANRSACHVVAVNWNAWLETGQAKVFSEATGRKNAAGLTNAEGMQVFGKVLCADDGPQLIVSKEDFVQRYRHFTAALPDGPSATGQEAREALPGSQPQPPGAYTDRESEDRRTLEETWKEVLGYPAIGHHDNFFELGGNSLTLVSLASKINKKFAAKVPIPQLYQLNTISKQALYLGINRKEVHDDVILMSDRKENYVFCFPPAIAYSVCYDGLARQLKDYSVCGFNFIESDDRIERYVEAILAIQPEGPYTLLAYSFGGVLMFNVAKALENRGCTVANLILLECIWHGNRRAEELNTGTDFFKGVELSLERLELDFLKDIIREKVVKYFEYTHNYLHLEKVNARLHSIISEERDFLGSVSAWKNFTHQDFVEYNGFGDHMGMLSAQNLIRNARIIASILDNSRNPQLPKVEMQYF